MVFIIILLFLYQIKLLNEQLDQQIQANTKAPSATMKALVERLKNELALKEGQHKVGTTL